MCDSLQGKFLFQDTSKVRRRFGRYKQPPANVIWGHAVSWGVKASSLYTPFFPHSVIHGRCSLLSLLWSIHYRSQQVMTPCWFRAFIYTSRVLYLQFSPTRAVPRATMPRRRNPSVPATYKQWVSRSKCRILSLRFLFCRLWKLQAKIGGLHFLRTGRSKHTREDRFHNHCSTKLQMASI